MTHAGLAVIAYYHDIFRFYPMVMWGVTIAITVSLFMIIVWTILYRKHAQCIKTLQCFS